MNDPHRERYLALKRYRADLEREIARLEKRKTVAESYKADMAARQEMIQEYCRTKQVKDLPDSPVLALPDGPSANPEELDEALRHVISLSTQVAGHLKDLAKFYEKPVSTSQTTEEANPRWSPPSDYPPTPGRTVPRPSGRI